MKENNSRRTFITVLTMVLLGILPQLAHAEPSPQEIVKQSLKAFYYAGNDMSVRVSMSLINAQGKQRRRELTLLRRNMGASGAEQRYFIYFHAPADVSGMTFMVWKMLKRDDDRWIFIPAIKMVRRIAANDKRSSFVGSDFTYEDVSGREVTDENHKLLRSESWNGQPCFVIESRPISSSDYSRRTCWIDKKNWLPLKEEYVDARGQKIREFIADEVKEVGGHWTVTKRTMKNFQTGHRTEVVFSQLSYNVGLEDDLFTERYLSQPPRKWIH